MTKHFANTIMFNLFGSYAVETVICLTVKLFPFLNLELDVEGQIYDVLIKEVDFNPLAGRVDEIDFQALVSNEKVHPVAEIVIVNHDKVLDGVLQENMEEVNCRAYPSALVDKIEVDVSGLKVGDTIRVKDLSLAKDKDIDIKDDPDAVVLTVVAVHNGAVPETVTPEEETAEEN